MKIRPRNARIGRENDKLVMLILKRPSFFCMKECVRT